MLRPDRIVRCVRVDRNNPAGADQVANMGENQRAAAFISPDLDDEIRFIPDDDFLVDPEIEWTLEHLMSHPGQYNSIETAPGIEFAVVKVRKIVDELSLLFSQARFGKYGAKRTE